MFDRDEHLLIQHSSKKKMISGEVSSVDFQNDGYHIVYIPSLKLSAYGKDLYEASKMMTDIVIPDFCLTLMQQPWAKIINDFKALGWHQNTFFRKELSKSSHIDKEGILRDFDLSEDTKINESLISVAA